jgi:FKBP-type peptidyl-prolyl cis-trans isomerase FklB
MVRAMKHPNFEATSRIAIHPARTCGLWVLMAVVPLAGAQTPSPAPVQNAPLTPAPAAPADTSSEHTSYLFGLTFGEQMHSVGISDQVNPDAITQGVKDGLAGKKSTRADQQQIQAFVQTVMVASMTRNKAAAQEFLARNGHDKNVKTTPSGLQYKILVPGNAKAAPVLPTDEVTVNYRGKLLDGSEFDSSYARGVPATFKITGVIKGWQEALVLMKPGAKWQLFIPPELAYDASPRPGIPAGSLLIFDVDLVSVKPGSPDAPAQPLPRSRRAVPPLTPTPNP